MRPLVLALLLFGCSEASNSPAPPPSPCREERFDGSAFTVCESTGPIQISTGSRTFAELQAKLGKRATTVAFAMNAGMFDDAGKPIGLMTEDGREAHAINRRKGFGNFHLMPNGVFLVRRDGAVEVVTSDAFKPSPDIAYATQSGPMLLVGGQLHPKIEPDGASHFIRNAVGIGPDRRPRFVISVDAVSFGKLARFMRDRLKMRDALYLDGSVSSLWDPANNRMDNFTDLGPMIVAFRPEQSTPGRASRARP